MVLISGVVQIFLGKFGQNLGQFGKIWVKFEQIWINWVNLGKI